MHAKIGSVVTTTPTKLEAFGALSAGKPSGTVVMKGALDGRDAVLVCSAQEAIELSNALVLAAAVACGVQTTAVELTPQGDGSSALRIVKH